MQANLAQAAVGTGGHEPQVVGELHQVDGKGLEQAGHLHEHVVVLRHVHGVLGGCQPDASLLPQNLYHAEAVAAVRRVAEPDRRSTDVHLPQPLLHFIYAPAVARDGLRRRAELLAQRDGHGVHELGSAQLAHVVELVLAPLERFLQAGALLAQLTHAADGRDAQGGGVDVVGGLAAVHVVNGADGAAQLLGRHAGQDLVHVHVGGRARAALQRLGHELVVRLARQHAVARAGNRVVQVRVHAQLGVGARGRLFDLDDCVNQPQVNAAVVQRKVEARAAGLLCKVFHDGLLWVGVGCRAVGGGCQRASRFPARPAGRGRAPGSAAKCPG